MSLVITEPIKTVNGLLTYALAADSQLLYTFQRADDIIIDGLEGPSKIVVAGDKTATYVNGLEIVIKFDVDPNSLSGTYTVGSSAFNTPNTEIIVTGLGAPVPDSGSLLILPDTKVNYRIEIQVLDSLSVSMFDQTIRY
ncbi:unnamed protein product, partial [marine sediment metagenome]